jgi:hypothetical protein
MQLRDLPVLSIAKLALPIDLGIALPSSPVTDPFDFACL